MRSMDDEDIDFTLQVVEEEDINNIFSDELDVDCELLSQIRIMDESPTKIIEIHELLLWTAWVEHLCHLCFGIYHVNSYNSDQTKRT